ncbi:MAG: HIT family protein [Flavobacteriales bacterium]|nr:HIT family protein [Flavobacteriales bacterium]
MDSIFTKIINKEIPAYIIGENDDFIAFLDVFPLAKGHTLVIPKKQVDYIFDLDENTYLALWKFAQKIAAKVENVVECKRIGIAVIGLEVPHAHIHLVPLNNVEDINFSRPKLQFKESEFLEIQEQILNA